jgi:hypothetical protein
MAGGIQTQVNGVPTPGVAGDFADSNPGFRVLSGPGGLVSGSTPYGTAVVTNNYAYGTAVVGQFGWLCQQAIDPDNAATIVNSFWSPGSGVTTGVTGIVGAGAPDGFISRPDSPAIITIYLADATMVVQQGAPVPLWAGGRAFWVINNGTTSALVGQKCYADLATGKASFGVTGSPSHATSSSASVAAGTWSATGSINGNVMTVGTVSGSASGVVPGATVTYSGSPSGLVVVNQLSGVAGAAGTYSLNMGEFTVASGTSLSGTYGIMTAGGTITGTFEIGGVATGTLGSFVAGTMITGFGTGAGGAGTYFLSNNTVISAQSIEFTTNVETLWIARSSGGIGEPVKISTIIQ